MWVRGVVIDSWTDVVEGEPGEERLVRQEGRQGYERFVRHFEGPPGEEIMTKMADPWGGETHYRRYDGELPPHLIGTSDYHVKGKAYCVVYAVSPGGTTTFFKGEPSKEFKVLETASTGDKIFYDPPLAHQKQQINKILHADGRQTYYGLVGEVPVEWPAGHLTTNVETSIAKTSMTVFPDKLQLFQVTDDGNRTFKMIQADGTQVWFQGPFGEECKRVVLHPDGSIDYFAGERGKEFLTHQVFTEPDTWGPPDCDVCKRRHKYVSVNGKDLRDSVLHTIESVVLNGDTVTAMWTESFDVAGGSDALRRKKYASGAEFFYDGPVGEERKTMKRDPKGKKTYYWGPPDREYAVSRRVQLQHCEAMQKSAKAAGFQWDGSVAETPRPSDGPGSKHVFESQTADRAPRQFRREQRRAGLDLKHSRASAAASCSEASQAHLDRYEAILEADGGEQREADRRRRHFADQAREARKKRGEFVARPALAPSKPAAKPSAARPQRDPYLRAENIQAARAHEAELAARAAALREEEAKRQAAKLHAELVWGSRA